MPELPEVETLCRDLEQQLTGQRIAQVELLWDGVVDRPDSSSFKREVAGQLVTRVARRGKYLIWHLTSGAHLVIHLRMTGRLYWPPLEEPTGRHVRAIFQLEDGRRLHFADQRKFGRLYLLADVVALEAYLSARLGPEPLQGEFTVAALHAALARRRGPLKAALLDQRLLAGLGNIYVDEALFRAGLHPVRAARTVLPEEAALLHAAIQAALRQGIANRGTTLSSFRDSWGSRGLNQERLLVFRRQGQPCPTCARPIEKMRVGGRGTHVCPVCQPLGLPSSQFRVPASEFRDRSDVLRVAEDGAAEAFATRSTAPATWHTELSKREPDLGAHNAEPGTRKPERSDA